MINYIILYLDKEMNVLEEIQIASENIDEALSFVRFAEKDANTISISITAEQK